MQESVTGCLSAAAGVDEILPVVIGKEERRCPGAGLINADLLLKGVLEWTRLLLLRDLPKELQPPQMDSILSRSGARTCGRGKCGGEKSQEESLETKQSKLSCSQI